MARTDNASAGKRGRKEGGKHIRYTDEQIRVLEKVYAECTNPDRSKREQMMRQQPILNGIDNKQLKIWFQNRRCREKQKKEHGDILAENKKLQVANQLLREENNALLKRVAELVRENDRLRNQLLAIDVISNTANLASELQPPPSPQPSINDDDDDDGKGLPFLADEARKEFLSKATGTAINWVLFPMQELHGPISIGEVYVSYGSLGVAARARTVVPFEPLKIIEILKDIPSWSRKCRKLDVLAIYPANNWGTIELVYTQYYAPTTLACARDFWTLRYTSTLDDGSFVVCEKSINACSDVPSSPAALEFVRGKMLASGYLICPCEGGSTVNLIAHLDFEASSVPELVRPLYESSELVAKEMIFPALEHINHLASEVNVGKKNPHSKDSAFVRSFGQKLSTGFNDAVNGFNEDGWQLMNTDAPKDAIISMERTNDMGFDTSYDRVICVKASVPLQNVFPAKLVGLLKDHRSTWMDFNFDEKPEAIIRAPYFAFPGVNTHNLSDNAVLLGHTNHEDEVLEVIRFERFAHLQHNDTSEELYHLQVASGMESMVDTRFGASSELIFAPIDKTIPNDAILLCSGFRIVSMGSNRVKWPSAYCAEDEASSSSTSFSAINSPCSMMILAFQFPSETRFEEDVRSMALEYIQHVISSVKNICQGVIPSGSNLEYTTDENVLVVFDIIPDSAYDINRLAVRICQSYRSYLGVEMCDFHCLSTGTFLELVQNHQYAILCFSFTSPPICLYANQAAVDMLETRLHNLQTLPLDQILDGSSMSLYSMIATITQLGYATLPPGCCLSMMNRRISYEQGVVWRVEELDGSSHCFAAAFINWSFD